MPGKGFRRRFAPVSLAACTSTQIRRHNKCQRPARRSRRRCEPSLAAELSGERGGGWKWVQARAHTHTHANALTHTRARVLSLSLSVPHAHARERDKIPIPFSPGDAGEAGDKSLAIPVAGSPPVAQSDSATEAKQDPDAKSLEAFLISRAVANERLGHFFFWYLWVECKDKEKRVSRKYIRIWNDFVKSLEAQSLQARRAMLSRQRDFLAGLRNLAKDLKAMKIDRKKKVDKLRQILAESEEFVQFDPLPLPVDPDVKVVGIVPEKAHIFKSALTPLGLTFRTTTGGEYGVIFKTGDDLRQDQLVIQIITLMDQLLKKENLDLKLTPYGVLATSANHGLVQFIPGSPAIAGVLTDHGSIQNYFRKFNTDEKAPYSINKDVMDNYVKSCAGYCVVTFLLGVGDRHLDNLLLCQDGHLFHIDFGYILGRDPKPYPPPFKLSKEMVEGMGGVTSDEMRQFRSHCYNAFLILRKNANLILNLFAMMVDSNVHDIALDPDKTVMKVQDKFRLDLSEEAAIKYFQETMDESVNAMFPQFIEKLHTWAQYWRK
eukprot:m.444882 g.444882  ORF g.444882 m.444882 type:complete len:547 (+) comp20300_c6_seq2:1212-2852(+)